MFVKKVTLHNFRNYAEKTVCFTQGLNVIMGPNATGKTNLLESVYMCGLGGSPRVSRDKDVILWGEKGAPQRIVEKVFNSSKATFLWRNPLIFQAFHDMIARSGKLCEGFPQAGYPQRTARKGTGRFFHPLFPAGENGEFSRHGRRGGARVFGSGG